MTVIERLRNKEIPEEVLYIAKKEGVGLNTLKKKILKGEVVVFRNNKRKVKNYCAVGSGLRTKVNVNIGTSPQDVDLEKEKEKIRVAERYGADTIMDLSTGGDLDYIRKVTLSVSSLPVGTVPIYQAMIEMQKEGIDDVRKMIEKMFEVIERHLADGVDFVTVHCGVTYRVLNVLKREGRVIPAVSRGGAFLLEWMGRNRKENPLYAEFDRLVEIAKEYDAVLSLGDGMRPGCIADSTDKVQMMELEILASLSDRALKKGVQVIIEGPGHLPINDIRYNMKYQKKICRGKPFYVLGPLVTDVAPGYDHITAAIGGAIAGMYGADFLCYVTPAEHLRLPTVEDVRDGIISARIAGHVADIGKGLKGSKEWDLAMSKARFRRDWKKQIELAIDPEKPKGYLNPDDNMDVCSMCGKYCAMKMVDSDTEVQESE